MMSPQDIRAAVAANAAWQALAASRSWADLAAAMSEGRTVVGAVPRNEFAIWAGSTGIRSKVEDHAANAQSPLRAVALTVIDFLRGAAESLDLSKAANQGMLAAWVGVQAITLEQADELVALATKPDPVSAQDIERAIGLQPVSTWTGEVTGTSLEEGNGNRMVRVQVTFTSSVQGVAPIIDRRLVGDNITPGYVATYIANRCTSLQEADAALALFG